MISIESIGNCADRRRILTATLASLPRSYTFASSGETADSGLVAAVCAGEGWTDHVAVAVTAGYRAVVVIEPGAAEPATVQRLAADVAATAVPVVLARRWASNPAISAGQAQELQGAEVSTRVLLDSQVTFTGLPLRDALCAQLDLLQTLYREPVTIGSWSSGEDAYLAAGWLDPTGQNTPVQLAGARTAVPPGSVRVRELLSNGARTLRLFGGDSARPGEVSVSGVAGQWLRPTIYESGYRAALLALRDELAGQRSPTEASDLDRYATTLAVLPVEL